jgi:hypothetical protein
MTDVENAQKLEEIGRCAYESICEMVAAYQCDYDRLEELREERSGLVDARDELANEPPGEAEEEFRVAVKAIDEWDAENGEELTELEAAAGECKDADEARQRIEEDALSVEIRSGWTVPGNDMEPEEFCLLLTTGGPAVRIRGELDSNLEPYRAWLEVQDWFLPWTEYVPADKDILLAYASCFYYGG